MQWIGMSKVGCMLYNKSGYKCKMLFRFYIPLSHFSLFLTCFVIVNLKQKKYHQFTELLVISTMYCFDAQSCPMGCLKRYSELNYPCNPYDEKLILSVFFIKYIKMT